jgi:hypothetical protein
MGLNIENASRGGYVKYTAHSHNSPLCCQYKYRELIACALCPSCHRLCTCCLQAPSELTGNPLNSFDMEPRMAKRYDEWVFIATYSPIEATDRFIK